MKEGTKRRWDEGTEGRDQAVTLARRPAAAGWRHPRGVTLHTHALRYVLVLALGLPVLLTDPARAQTYELPWYTFDGGGEMYSIDDGYVLGGTIGQADAGTMSGEGYSLRGGFWGRGAPLPAAPDPEPGGPACATSADCVGDWIGADCVDGICYVPKNRYLSIDPTTNPDPVAYQVAVADGSPAGACMGPPFTPTRCTTNADCEPTQTCEQYYSPGIVGRQWWLDVPQCIEGYNSTEVIPAPNPSCTGIWFDPVDGFDKVLFGWVSRLTSAPVTRTWVEVPLQVTDCAVAPMLAYEIRASADSGGSFSDPLQINTIHDPGGVQFWGDLTETPGGGVYWPPGAAMNFDDIQSAINTFLSLPVNTGPPQAWVEMETNHVITLGDIQFLIKAFGGTYYRDIGPFWAGPRFLIGGDPAACP